MCSGKGAGGEKRFSDLKFLPLLPSLGTYEALSTSKVNTNPSCLEWTLLNIVIILLG